MKFFFDFNERPRASLAVLLGFSLLVKVVLIYQTDIINPDGIRYINSAHELFQGNLAAAFAHEKMLGFTLLLGLVHLIVPDWFLAGMILSCVALVLTTIPVYYITQELFGRRAAFYAALIFSVAPAINGKCTSVIKDPSFLFLIILSLWFVIYALQKSRWGFSWIAGLLSCLSMLIRPEGVVFFFIVALFLAVSVAFLPVSRRLSLKCLAAFCVLPLSALFLVVIAFISGAFSPEDLSAIYKRFALYFQTDLLSIYRNIYQHLKDVEENFSGGQFTNDFFEYARYNIYLIYLIGLLQTFSQKLFPVFVLPLIFGLQLRGKWNKEVVLLLTVLGSFFLMDYLFLMSRNFISGRYLLIPIVLGFVLVGHGMDRMTTVIATFHKRRTVFAIAIVLCVFLPLGRVLASSSSEKTEIKEAGLWLRDNKGATNVRIIVNEERIAYYAGLLRGNYDTFKDKKIKRLEKKALQKNCKFIVIYGGKGDADTIPSLSKYILVEKISGRKKVAMIYERKQDG